MSAAKTFEISKTLVLQAYKEVKSNGGSAGIDEESIQEFERNLKGNLYRIWNRMASGCYFFASLSMRSIVKKFIMQSPCSRTRL